MATARNEKLQSILDSRNACLSALKSKGSAVTSSTPFSEYADAIRAIGGGGGGVLDNADMVYAGNVAYLCMTVTSGTVDIEWGDGTTETVQSSSSEQFLAHEYETPGLHGVTLASSSDASISLGDYVYTSTGLYNGKKSVLVIVNSTPDGLTSIGDYAFQNCSSLASISLPDGLTSIGIHAFSGCSTLGIVSLPDGLTSIGLRAFYNCSSLGVVSFSDGLTSIGDDAFYDCSSLASISLPNGLTSIGDYAFKGCSSLSFVSLPDGLTRIGDSAFSGCIKAKTIYSKASTPPTLGNSTSLPGSYVKNIYVPVGAAYAYKSATNWSAYAYVISEMNVEDMP